MVRWERHLNVEVKKKKTKHPGAGQRRDVWTEEVGASIPAAKTEVEDRTANKITLKGWEKKTQ